MEIEAVLKKDKEEEKKKESKIPDTPTSLISPVILEISNEDTEEQDEEYIRNRNVPLISRLVSMVDNPGDEKTEEEKKDSVPRAKYIPHEELIPM